LPHRVFNIKEVATYLHLSPDDVETLVRQGEIPHEKQGGRAVFKRAEIDSWASQRILKLPGERLRDYHGRSSARLRDISLNAPLMPRLFTCDRIATALHSRTRASVIRDMVKLAEQTDLVSDPADLLRMIEERERMCSTALPEGYALIHPRHHDPYMFAESFAVFGRCVQPIHFGAQDGAPTDLFFAVCCQDDRIHLHTLARLCTMCMQTGLLAALRQAETAAQMLAALCESEEEIVRRL
jgi:PTS system nitrogen regulatory IIA component